MKLRIHGDSLRLRLDSADVTRFRETGIGTNTLSFGPGSQLTYTLERSVGSTMVDVEYRGDCIRFLLPLGIATDWAGSDQISISRNRADSGGPSLLIEKDFECAHGERNERTRG